MRYEDEGTVERLEKLEVWASSFEARLVRLEGGATRPATVDRRAAPTRPRPLQDVSLEDLLGGRVLAWIGGLAVLVGIFFLFAIGISHGWIGEGARTLTGAAGALALLGVGVWLRERRERTDASVAATAAGIAGLFAAVTVATQAYELVPAVAGIVLALCVGAIATVLAVRWNAQGIGALGIVGAVAAPVAVGAELSILTLVLLLAANASAVGVLLWRRWDWLAFATVGLATGQWVLWLLAEDTSPAAIVVVLSAFGALNIAAAVGLELRTRAARLRIASYALLALNAVALAPAGYFSLDFHASTTAAHAWLIGLALGHLVVGLMSGRSERVSRELRLASTSIGVVLADVAFASVVDGLPLAIGWAATGAGFAVLLAGQSAVDGGRLRRWLTGLDSDAPAASYAFALLGLGGHIALALGHALVVQAPPKALVEGLDDPLAATLALGAVIAATIPFTRLEGLEPSIRLTLKALAAATALYLASTELVTPFQPGGDATGLPLAELDIRQQGQALLSGLWALVGVAALLAGLARDRRALRIGALSLLGITIAKVFLFDLASLTSIYRVISFVALGILLLGAAFAWQRIRPGATSPTPEM